MDVFYNLQRRCLLCQEDRIKRRYILGRFDGASTIHNSRNHFGLYYSHSHAHHSSPSKRVLKKVFEDPQPFVLYLKLPRPLLKLSLAR